MLPRAIFLHKTSLDPYKIHTQNSELQLPTEERLYGWDPDHVEKLKINEICPNGQVKWAHCAQSGHLIFESN